MGKAITLFGFWIVVCMLCMVYQESISDINPSVTASGAIFGKENLLGGYLSNDTQGSIVLNTTLNGAVPERDATGTSDTGTAYPDWTQSMLSWGQTIFGPILNFVGTPYYLLMWMNLGDLAAVLGAMLSVINLVVIVGWITGRID